MLSKEQQQAVNLILAGNNLFINAVGGTGKSYLIQEACKQLKNYVVLGTTGIAATNVNGCTIHSFFGVNPYGIAIHELRNNERLGYRSPDTRAMWQATRTIIIDEISMMRADLLDACDLILKRNGCEGLDSKQLIFIGDLGQLTPILAGKEETKLYYTLYNGLSFKDSEIYKNSDFKEITLTHIFRQSDVEYKHQLDLIRQSKMNYLLPYFNQFVKLSPNPNSVIIAGFNEVVDKYNKEGLNQINEPLITLEGETKGLFKEKDFLTTKTLQVKHGCRIMYLKNDKDLGLNNGTLGTLIIQEGVLYIKPDGENQQMLPIVPVEFEYKEYHSVVDDVTKQIKPILKTVSTLKQFPIKLCYALSVHKCQGLSLANVTLDIRRKLIAPNSLYVALSRVTSPEGLTILV
jgi:ATP-dependent exoDNAse (exonuclease V) alpha subunit